MEFKTKEQVEDENSPFTVEPQNCPKKKKKGLHGFPKFLVIFFSIIIGLPILLVGVCFACFYDAGHTEVEVYKNYKTDNMFNDLLVDSFDNANVAGVNTVSLDVKEKQLNSIFADLLNSKPEIKAFVPNFYIDTNEDTFQMVLEGNVYNFFKSRIFVTAHYKMENANGEQTIVFDITDIKIGRISGMEKVIGWVKGVTALPDLSQTFADLGFNLKVDLDKLQITYKVSDFCNDIKKIMGESEASGFLKLVLEILTGDNFINVRGINGPDEGSLLSFDMELAKVKVTEAVHGITGYNVPDGYFTDELNYTVNAVKNILNTQSFPSGQLERANIGKETDLLAKYIMGGTFFTFNTEEQAELDRLDAAGAFSGLTIPQYNYNLPDEKKLENVVKAQMPTMLVSSHDVFITANNINESLSCTAATGIIASFVRNMAEDDTKDYKVNYVCTDRIGAANKGNNMYVFVNMNINGYDTQLTFDCVKDTTFTEWGKMKFNIGDLYFGDCKTSSGIKDEYIGILTQALASAGGVITASGTTITIDLATVLASEGITESLVDCDISMVDFDPSNATSGGFKITLTPKF